MSFIEDQEIDLLYFYERVSKTLHQDLGGANHDHVVKENLVPQRFVPCTHTHGSIKKLDVVVQVAF